MGFDVNVDHLKYGLKVIGRFASNDKLPDDADRVWVLPATRGARIVAPVSMANFVEYNIPDGSCTDSLCCKRPLLEKIINTFSVGETIHIQDDKGVLRLGNKNAAEPGKYWKEIRVRGVLCNQSGTPDVPTCTERLLSFSIRNEDFKNLFRRCASISIGGPQSGFKYVYFRIQDGNLECIAADKYRLCTYHCTVQDWIGGEVSFLLLGEDIKALTANLGKSGSTHIDVLKNDFVRFDIGDSMMLIRSVSDPTNADFPPLTAIEKICADMNQGDPGIIVVIPTAELVNALKPLSKKRDPYVFFRFFEDRIEVDLEIEEPGCDEYSVSLGFDSNLSEFNRPLSGEVAQLPERGNMKAKYFGAIKFNVKFLFWYLNTYRDKGKIELRIKDSDQVIRVRNTEDENAVFGFMPCKLD